MNVAGIALLFYIFDIVRLDEECIKCSATVSSNCFTSCDETIKIALESAVYSLPVYDTIDSSLNTTKFEGTSFISVTSNPHTGTVYLATADAIYKYNEYDGDPTLEAIITESVHFPTGLDIDMVTGDIYWADHTTATIYVAGPDGKKKCTVLVLSPEERPYGLTVDSVRRRLFWSEPYAGKVRQSNLDGTNVELVASDLNFPTGISSFRRSDDPTMNYFVSVMTVGEETGVADNFTAISSTCSSEGCTVKTASYEPFVQENITTTSRYANAVVTQPDFNTYITVVQDGKLKVVKIDFYGKTDLIGDDRWVFEYHENYIPGIALSSYRRAEGVSENICQDAGCHYRCIVHADASGGLEPICLCQDGYTVSDTEGCVPSTRTILYTDQLNIVKVELESKREAVLELDDDWMQVGVGLDYDQLTQTVYWSDIRFQQIVKAKERENPVVVRANVGHPSGLCVDWITKYIYYVDDDTNTVNVLNNNGSEKATLVSFGDSPRSIKVDPVNGLLFWTDRGSSPMIIRSMLSGEGVTVVTSLKEAGSYPNGVALDIPNKWVYWIDAGTDKIMGTDYMGSGEVKTMVQLSASQGFSLAILDDYFYWSDWQQERIGRVAMDGSSEPETVVQAYGVIMDIVAFSDDSKHKVRTNPCSVIPCSHFCFVTGDIINPFTCGCSDGVQLDPDNMTSCETSKCAIDNGGCPQKCTLDEQREVLCKCFDYYEEVKGVCVESFLLLSTKLKIYKISALGDSAHEQTLIDILGTVVAVDFDVKNHRVFWTDTLNDAIYVSDLSGNNSKMVLGQGLLTPDGIAYDWVSDTIYWSDMGTNIIGATKSDGAYIRNMITFEGNDKPRALVVDPQHGMMYFTDWGTNSGIFSAWLDGSNVTKIVTNHILWPNGLTIDRNAQVLYWVDAKEDVLERVNVDGTGREILTEIPDSHSFALTLYFDSNGDSEKERILFTDWRTKSIVEVKLSNTTEYQQYSDASQMFAAEQPFDIHWFSAAVQTGTNGCGVENGGCSHFCFNTPSSELRCGCPQNIQLEDDGLNCVKDPCSVDNGGCEHSCSVSETGNITCSCQEWYKPDPTNSSRCVESDLSMFVLERNDILEVSMDTDPIYKKTISLQPAISSGVSMDVDIRAKRIFWCDSLRDTISSANFDGSDPKTVVTGLKVPDGIAVDWLVGNIYWVDTGPDKIFAARSDDGSSKLILKITGLDRPRAIVLAPTVKYLFWTDWGTNGAIGRADMDGTNQFLLADSGLGWPNGLAFDPEDNTLYWSDALEDRIESISLNGTSRTVVASDNIQHPYGFHFFNDHIYWTDWTSQSIKKMHKSGSGYESLVSFETSLMDIAFKSPEHQMPGPCYREGQTVSEFDMFHTTYYVGVKGDKSTINLTISYEGSEKELQLKIRPGQVQVFDFSANMPTNVADLPLTVYPGNANDYVKYFYITHGVCYTRHRNKQLLGFTSGRRRGYRNLERAKEACQSYGSDCRGITYEPDNSKLYKFSLREGSKPAASAINEISWVKTICENGESETLTIGSGLKDDENVLIKLYHGQAHSITKAVISPEAGSESWLCPGYISPCHVNNGGCDGLCLVTPTGRSCACEGDLDPLGVKCTKHDHLLLSAAFDILALELGGDIKKTQETKKIVQDESLIASMDYIFIRDSDTELTKVMPLDQIIWAEPNFRAIRISNADGTNPKNFLKHGGGVITSVVYDWVNKVVIWLDSMLGLFVSSLDGKHRATLYVELNEPRILARSESLAVNPYRREVYWTVVDHVGITGGVYSLTLLHSTSTTLPRKLTTTPVSQPLSLTLDVVESRLYYSHVVDNAGYIRVVDVGGGEDHGREVRRFTLGHGVIPSHMDLAGDLLYIINSNTIITINKYTGELVRGLQIKFDIMLNGIKVLRKGERPKGIVERSCPSEIPKTISCPVSGSSFTSVRATLMSSPNLNTCGEATSSCSVDVSDQLLCLGLGTCSISPTSLDIKECHDVVGLIMEVEWECSGGNTACSDSSFCKNGICISDPFTRAPTCYCDEMHTFNNTDNSCYHEEHRIVLAVGNRFASYIFDGKSNQIEGLPLLPGKVGGISLIAAHGDQVYWWNNVTRNIYSSQLQTEAATVIIAENVDISSLDVDTNGQIWVLAKSEDTAKYDTIKCYIPDYHVTIYSSSDDVELYHLRVYSDDGTLFYVESSSSSNLLIRRKNSGQNPVTIHTERNGEILDMAVDVYQRHSLFVALDWGEIKVLDFAGVEVSTINLESVTLSTITSIIVPDKFLVVATESGVYKFRKTGDLIGTILESSDKENTTLPHVQLAYSGYSGGPCNEADCPYFCVANSAGEAQCICPDGYSRDPDTNECSGLCLIDNGGCSHICDVAAATPGDQGGGDIVGSVTCSCHVGYHLAVNGKGCIESLDFILVRANDKLYKYRADLAENNSELAPQLQGLTHFDFDYDRKQTIWYNKIKKALVRGNSTQHEVIHRDRNITDVTSVAYDWVTGNVYFIEGSFRSRIGVVSKKGSMSKFTLEYGLNRAKMLQLHPTLGLMYFVTFGESETFEIQQADLDGSNRIALYTLPSEPQGFALDTQTGSLFYTLAQQNVIMAGDVRGNGVREYLTTVNRPASISAYGGYVTWIESDGRIWVSTPGVTNIGQVNVDPATELKFYSPVKYGAENMCAQDNGGCEEFCFATPQLGVKCGCGGLTPLAADQRSCGAEPLLLISGTNEVIAVNIKTNETQTVISNLTQAVIVDYDLQEGKYYWTDVKDNNIYRADMTGENRELVVENGLVTPDGMAVDWVNRNLYWSDSHTSRFEVGTLDGKYRMSLHIERLSKPRGICIDPINGYVYWADWGAFPFIAKMELDGANMVVLAQQGLAWPNSLTIELESGKLLWADASRKRIGMMNVDGTGMKVVLASHVDHPFSIDHYLGTIFWSDWYKKAVMSWEYPDGVPTVFLPTHDDLQHGIKVVHSSKQPTGFRTGCTSLNGGCSQLCFSKPDNSRVCGCSSHFVLDTDEVTCIDPDHRLLVARGHELLHLVLDPTNSSNVLYQSVLPIGNITTIVAFDYHIEEKRMIVGDTFHSHISSYNLDGTDRRLLASITQDSVDGLAVDWITGNVFWSSVSDTQGKIEVVDSLGTARRTVVNDGMEKPRAVALDPVVGHVFWTEWGASKPAIERVDMDGSNRQVLVSQDVVWPNGLTLDLITHKMYWTEASLDYIGMANMDGSDPQKIVITNVLQPFSITLSYDGLLWTDWGSNVINYIKLGNYTDRAYILEGYKRLMTIHHYNDKTQIGTNDCRNNKFGCSHFCLKTPDGPKCACKDHIQLIDDKNCAEDPCETNNAGCSHTCSLSSSGVTCLCPQLFMLDPSDNTTCRPSQQSILISSQAYIYRVTLDTPTYQVSLLNYNAISYSLAIGFDTRSQRAIYRDSKIGIVAVSLDGQSVTQLNDDWEAFSIAVDNVAGNLYWVRRNLVRCSRTDGLHIRTLHAAPEDNTVTDIAVYPQRLALFWTVKSEASGAVMRSRLDGSDAVAVDSLPIRPFGIAVDYRDDRVYYADLLDGQATLISINMNGSNRKKIHQGKDYMFVDLAIDNGVLYWTQNLQDNLNSAKLPGFTEPKNMISYLSKGRTGIISPNVYDLVIVNATVPDGLSGCEDNTCEGLCFGDGPGKFHCACEDDVPVSQTNSSRCGSDPLLLRVHREVITSRDLLSGEDRLVKDGLTGATAVAVHTRRNLTLWVDNALEKILGIDSTGTVKEIVGHSLVSVTAIEVDYVTDKVYWLEKDRNGIGVGDLSGLFQSMLPLHNVSKVTAFTLSPKNRIMVFADSNLHTLNRASMDGTDQIILLSASEDFALTSVKCMTIDVVTSAIYWSDSDQNYIAYMKHNDTTPIKLTSVVTSFASSIFVFERHLYYSERLDQDVYKYNLDTKMTQLIVHEEDIADIKVNHISQQPAVTSGCSVTNGGCSHLCLLSESEGFSCACANGLILGSDGKMCVEPELYLLLAGRTKLFKVPLDQDFPAPAAILPFSAQAAGAIAVAADVLNKVFFWSDVSTDAIVKGWYNASGFYQENIVTADVKTPDGMTFDWVSQLLYWSDTAMTHIQVCKPDGSSRKTLLSGLDKPRALALDYLAGHLFWSEWGSNPRIARSDTDGHNPITLVNGSDNVGWPNGMTVHHADRILYWADAKLDMLVSYDLKIKKKTVLLNSNVLHPFGLAVFQDHLYWTDWMDQSVLRLDRHRPDEQPTTVVSGLRDLMGIAVVHDQAQPQLSITNCSYRNGEDYRGTVSTTISGKTCQSWNSQTPNTHDKTEQNFPFAGLGSHNYCRNPNGEPFPWCFTTDRAVRWEYCSIKRCGHVRYEHIARNLSFWDAQHACVTLGGNLATIQSDKDNNFIRSQINPGPRGLVWIGLENVQGNSSFPFMWLSGDGSRYQNFAEHAHNFPLDNSGWAVAMNVRTGEWLKRNSKEKFPSTCEIYSEPEGYTSEGNANGAMCSFPFYLKDKLRYSCQPTEEDNPSKSKVMCGTVAVRNEMERKWGYCHAHSSSIDQTDNVVNEIVALIDGLENDKPVIGALPCDTAVTNLTLVRGVNMPVHQIILQLSSGSVTTATISSVPCTNIYTLRDPSSTTVVSCDVPIRGGQVEVLFAEDSVVCAVKLLTVENLAIGRTTMMSNPVSEGASALAVDGISGGKSQDECATSQSRDLKRRRSELDILDSAAGGEDTFVQGPQFLRVDLGESKQVAQVLIYVNYMMNPFEVRVGDDETEEWGVNPSCGNWNYMSESSNFKRINCGLTGRYVTVVVRDETASISICELEVYATPAPTYGGTANGAPCQHPFVANGEVIRDGCVVGGKEPGQQNTPWCYTVPEESNQLWGYCHHAPDVDGCAFDNGGCSELCFNTPVGVRCGCPDFIQLQDDGKTCRKDPCKIRNGGCQETCMLSEGGAVCGCRPWFKLNDDGVSCSESEQFLIGANKTTIFNLSLDSDPGALKVLMKDVGTTIGVAYSQKKQTIFWTDSAHDAIFSANFDGSNKKIIVSEGIKSPDCIAYDWISDLIFWSDNKAESIEVARYDGKFRNVVVNSNTKSPRGVAVHPMEGKMFWTDWGETPMIESASMNGDNRIAIVTENIVWPNGITIDYAENKIIWVDAKLDTIETANLDGSSRKVIENVDVVHPFGATLYGDEIFWTDWGRKSVEAIHKNDGSHRRTVYSGINYPMNIFALSDQTGRSACSSRPCPDGICIPVTSSDRVCLCERMVQPDENGSCDRVPMLYVAMTNKIVAIDLTKSTVPDKPVMTVGANSLDFDQLEQRIYVASNSSIYSFNMDGTDRRKVLDSEAMDMEFPTISDLSVDWIGRNIYYVDFYLGNIYACSMNGKYRSAVVRGVPRLLSIAVSMKDKEIIYSTIYDKHDNSGIFKISLDGKGEPIQIHNNESAGSVPWGLRVDYESNKLFWFNRGANSSQNYLYSSNLDGSQVTKHKRSSSYVINLLAVHQDQVFYFDSDTESITSYNKSTGQDTGYNVKIEDWWSISSSRLVHPSQQPWVSSKCGSGKSPCEQLCLLNADHQDHYSCLCSLGYTEIPSVGCVQDRKFVMMVTYSGIYQVNINRNAFPIQLPIQISPTVERLHVNPVSKEIIFLDSSLGRIGRTTFEGKLSKSLVDRFLEGARELQVDFVSKLMFWIVKDTLQVAKTNGLSRRTLLSSGMSGASQLTVDGVNGVIRWVEDTGTGSRKKRTSEWVEDTGTGSRKKRTSDDVVVNSATYSGTKLKQIILPCESVESLDISPEHGILIWVNKLNNKIQYTLLNDLSAEVIQVTTITPPEVGTITHVTMTNDEIYYGMDITENTATLFPRTIGSLYRTSLSDLTSHSRLTNIPSAKNLAIYDSGQSYWRGKRKEIQRNEDDVTFGEAQTHCRDVFNGTLATIEDDDQNMEMFEHLQSDELWIGLSRLSGTWEWQDSTLPQTYTNWAAGQPAFSMAQAHYAVMGTDGKWYGRTAQDRRGFLCERVVGVNPCYGADHGCSHLCLPGPNSEVTCACPQFIRLGRDSKTCEPDPCDTADCKDGCYLISEGRAKCTCPPGMLFREDDNTCTTSTSSLIIATSNSLVSHTLDSDVPEVEKIFQSYVRSTTSLAVDAHRKRIFFSDGISDEVLVIDKFTPRGGVDVLFREPAATTKGITDLAYEWISDSLFYVINGVEIKTRKLEDMQETEVILVESTTITSIWLHPTYNYMFYTLSDGSVKRSTLEGAGVVTVFSETEEHFVHAVTSDPRNNKLYLATNRTVLATDLDGKLPVNHLNYGGDALPSQPIVAAMGNQIFWVQGDLHGDIVTRTKRSITTKGMQKKDKKLYYAHLEYASTGQYEQVMKIAIMDQDLQSGDIVVSHGALSDKTRKSLITGVVCTLAILLLFVVVAGYVRLRRRGTVQFFSFSSYRQLLNKDREPEMMDMGHVTYDNPGYDDLGDEDPVDDRLRLVQFPVGLINNNNSDTIEDYNIEVTTHGYDNDYEVSDDDNGIFDNDRI